MLLDRALAQHERLGDGRVALALCDLGEHFALARGELRRAASAPSATCAATSASTIIGSITEPPAATVWIAEASCVRDLHALLEQVGATLRPGLQQRQREPDLGVVG